MQYLNHIRIHTTTPHKYKLGTLVSTYSSGHVDIDVLFNTRMVDPKTKRLIKKGEPNGVKGISVIGDECWYV